jgi:hypothetical protein
MSCISKIAESSIDIKCLTDKKCDRKSLVEKWNKISRKFMLLYNAMVENGLDKENYKHRLLFINAIHQILRVRKNTDRYARHKYDWLDGALKMTTPCNCMCGTMFYMAIFECIGWLEYYFPVLMEGHIALLDYYNDKILETTISNSPSCHYTDTKGVIVELDKIGDIMGMYVYNMYSLYKKDIPKNITEYLYEKFPIDLDKMSGFIKFLIMFYSSKFTFNNILYMLNLNVIGHDMQPGIMVMMDKPKIYKTELLQYFDFVNFIMDNTKYYKYDKDIQKRICDIADKYIYVFDMYNKNEAIESILKMWNRVKEYIELQNFSNPFNYSVDIARLDFRQEYFSKEK